MLRKSSNILFGTILLFALCPAAGADDWKTRPLPQPPTTTHPHDTLSRPDSALTLPLPKDSTKADTSSVRTRIPDTTNLEPTLYLPGPDTLFIKAYRTEAAVTTRLHSPTITLFKSVAFPGWGQYTNRKYLKAGVVFAAESYFIYLVIDRGKKASDWRKKWQAAPAELKSPYFRQYTDYRDSRNGDEWGVAIVIFVSMFDAYVDAHLASFPQREITPPGADSPHKLSLTPDISDGIALRLKYSF